MKIDKDLLAIAVVAVVAVMYYLVALQSPIVFGDEGYYSSVGRVMAQTGQYPIYEPYYGTDVYHQRFYKQPLFFFMNAGAWLLAGELGIKTLIPIFSALAGLMLYVFLRSLGKPNHGIAAAFILLMLPGMVTYGVLDYVETMNVLLVITALYFGYRALDSAKKEYALMSGVFTGLALITDITALFILPIILFWLLLSRNFSKWKPLLMIFVIAALVMAPYLARNLVLFNGFCYNFLPGDCSPVADVEIPHDPALDAGFTSDIVRGGGTSVGVLRMGVLNYFRFAWGWTASILLLFGLAFAFIKRDRPVSFLLIWLLFFLFLTAQQSLFGGRAEDIPRYTLFGYPALAAVAGLFVAEAYAWSGKKNILIGLVVVAFLAFSLWTFGQEKLNTMTSVKAFSLGFFEGCDWIRSNTPQDSVLFTIYGHHTAYHCDRRNANVLPDKAEIQLTNDERSYEHLKLHGFDYVFIQQFTMSQQSTRETVTPSFINYLETSPNFEKVYDNTQTYGAGGVRLYRVL